MFIISFSLASIHVFPRGSWFFRIHDCSLLYRRNDLSMEFSKHILKHKYIYQVVEWLIYSRILWCIKLQFDKIHYLFKERASHVGLVEMCNIFIAIQYWNQGTNLKRSLRVWKGYTYCINWNLNWAIGLAMYQLKSWFSNSISYIDSYISNIFYYSLLGQFSLWKTKMVIF